MKIRKQDILSISPGMTLSATLDSVKECISAKTYAYTLAKTEPRPDIERYSVTIDTDTCRISITAIAKK